MKLLRSIVFTVLLLGSSTSLLAQGQQPTQYYLKGGYTQAGFLGAEAEQGFAGGYSLGFGVKMPLYANAKWWWQAELTLGKYQAELLATPSAGRYSFAYVGVPLMLAYRANTIVEVHAGLQPAFLLEGSVRGESGGGAAFGKDEFRSLSIWPTAGLELNINPLAVGLRYMVNPLGLATGNGAEAALGGAKLHGIQIYGALVF